MFLHSQRPTPLTSLPSSSVFHSSGAPTTSTTRRHRFNLRLSVQPLAGSRLGSNSTFVVHQTAPRFLPSPSKLPSSTLTSNPRFERMLKKTRGNRMMSSSGFSVSSGFLLDMGSPGGRFCKNDAAETIKAIEENMEKYIKILL